MVAVGAALIGGVPAIACGATGMQSAPTVVARDGTVVAFRGEIDAVSAQALTETLQPSDTLLIRSDGGLRSAAVVVGRAVAARDATVDINGRCFSACALYVALPARRVLVGEGSTLLFHSTPAIWRTAIRQRPELFPPAERRRILDEADWLDSSLTERGIDTAILDCIDHATGADVNSLEARPPGAVDRPIIPMRYSFAWLSPRVLAHFGADNLQFGWSLKPEARQAFEDLHGQRIAWVDDPAQCR